MPQNILGAPYSLNNRRQEVKYGTHDTPPRGLDIQRTPCNKQDSTPRPLVEISTPTISTTGRVQTNAERYCVHGNHLDELFPTPSDAVYMEHMSTSSSQRRHFRCECPPPCRFRRRSSRKFVPGVCVTSSVIRDYCNE